MKSESPNVVFVFGDQWRAQAVGYAGNSVVQTPHIDALAGESINFTNAVAGIPVCTPWRACFLTGRYAHTHGVFLNDVCLSNDAVSIAQAFDGAGYQTAYIGKWHIDGHGRSNFIPRERRQGFDFWRVLKCTHNYNNSYYYGDANEKLKWEGYDAICQTREAQRYISDYDSDDPFLLVLSWGPPHAPYETAPDEYRARYRPEDIELRPNVTDEVAERARADIAGYYAHCTALDDCIGDLLKTLDEKGIADNTIFVFTSDHGDMLGSRGQWKKQRPWGESIMVPFLLRYPAVFGRDGRRFETPINTPDIMPTLLGLAGADIPDTVEGADYSGFLKGEENLDIDSALISCLAPFGQYTREQGGREYRGLYTTRYTYARDLDGPWLLYDNETDPYQLTNLCNDQEHSELQADLDAKLNAKLRELGDEFLPADEYLKRWGYVVNETGTVPYTN